MPRRRRARPPAPREHPLRALRCGWDIGSSTSHRIQWRVSAFLCGLRRRFGRRPIRIRDSELAQNLAFELFHLVGVFAALVVVAVEMQKSMHCKMGNMMGEWLSLATDFAPNGCVG